MKKTTKNIFFAFILNSVFAVIEVIGGFFTNSFAIISDGLHDFGDAFALGFAFFLEKKSEQKPDAQYTYGYRRYSVISALLTSLILIIGSVVIIYSAIIRIINPEPINGLWMLIFAVIGLAFNLLAFLITRARSSLNERAINLHMLEDVLGWIVVLIGSVFILIFEWYIIDPILSILVAIYISYHALKSLLSVVGVLTEKAPKDFPMEDYQSKIKAISGVEDVHHLHVWSLDGNLLLATLHIVLDSDLRLSEALKIKTEINRLSKDYQLKHITIQFDSDQASCENCQMAIDSDADNYHHHHHHH
ncbi:MAG: cation diffusion facilitator family transporter [Bacilli bacterium]|jgi:cobalt-zinc-cadmium efflux system protein|nr:cation diffusion facilitator family transporter [Bacilli bacterium]MDD3389578.1 cation diffusion facilitator family transporter [Bacilli bacterium]MDD4345212.1 cation diffusion facilitator family transporter [Bacilli bacterium]MDD4521282.1 cation diffusion facilitator family transporter [Bacilli bacterium]MDY0400033.1 cation diffusion facilitator family transporter [Bacilli bacterium]